MLKQKDKEDALLRAHRSFIAGLQECISILEKDIIEAGEMENICTDEWCQATENYIDELHKSIYSISEPRWATPEDSQKISDLRRQIKMLYGKYVVIGA